MVCTRGSKRRIEQKAVVTTENQKCVLCYDPNKPNTISMLKRRIEDAVQFIRLQKRRFTVPPQQYTRRKGRPPKKFQTDGNQRRMAKNVADGTVSHQIFQLELQTDVEAVTPRCPAAIPVFAQRKTRLQLPTDQASGVSVHATGENPTLQQLEMDMDVSQDAEQGASSKANPTTIVSVGDMENPSTTPGTEGPSELHLSRTLNACVETRNCNLTVSNFSATRGNFDGRATTSLNLTEFAALNDEDDLSDIDSLICDPSLVSVSGYLVKPENASVLASVLSKYGDIGAKCSLASMSVRSIFMEKICEILEKLSSTSIGTITEKELAEMRAFVSDIGNANVEVAWLQKRLDEIHEAKKAIPHLKPSSVLKSRHAESKKRLGAIKERFEAYKKEYNVKRAEAVELHNKLAAAQSEISLIEKEVLETDKAISESKAQLKIVLNLGSLANGLI